MSDKVTRHIRQFSVETLDDMEVQWMFDSQTFEILRLRVKHPIIKVDGRGAHCDSYYMSEIPGCGVVKDFGEVFAEFMHDTRKEAIAAGVPHVIATMNAACATYKKAKSLLRRWRREFPDMKELDAFIDEP